LSALSALPGFPKTRALLEGLGCVFLLEDLADISEEEAHAALHPEERALCSDMALSRRHEFAVGRMLAHKAFAQLAEAEPSLSFHTSKAGFFRHDSICEANGSCRKKACFAPLLRGTNGEPLWPEGIIGSITHTANIVALTSAKRNAQSGWPKAHSPGIDMEWLCRGMSDAAWKYILSPSEEKFISSDAPNSIRMLIFSAKESLFKALFPVVGRYIGFHEADILREDALRLQEQFPPGDDSSQRCPLSGSFRLNRAGECFCCHWEIDGGYVLTAIG